MAPRPSPLHNSIHCNTLRSIITQWYKVWQQIFEWRFQVQNRVKVLDSKADRISSTKEDLWCSCQAQASSAIIIYLSTLDRPLQHVKQSYPATPTIPFKRHSLKLHQCPLTLVITSWLTVVNFEANFKIFSKNLLSYLQASQS
jgi:hypothetical protein